MLAFFFNVTSVSYTRRLPLADLAHSSLLPLSYLSPTSLLPLSNLAPSSRQPPAPPPPPPPRPRARRGGGGAPRPRGGGAGTGRATRRAATATRGRANGRTRDETRGFGARARARVAVAKTRAREGATRGGTRGDGTRREATRDDDDARTREAGGADSVKGARGEDARDGRLPTISRGTYASLATALVALGFPALLNSVNEPVVSLLETVLVARVGTVFLAALAPASALFGLVEEVCYAFGVVVTTAVSALRAEADTKEKVRETVSLSVFASFICGSICALGLQALYGPICKIMVVPQEVDALLRTYTIARCVGLPLFSAANALEGAFLGSKDAIMPMIGWLTSGAITAALQLFFITPKLDPCLLYTSPSPRDQRG